MAVLLVAGAASSACKQSPPPPTAASVPTPAPPPRAAGPETPPPASTPALPTAVDAHPDPSAPRGTIKGKTVWPGIDDYRLTLQIVLIGDDPFNQGKMIATRTRLGEPYSAWVPAGGYLLRAQVGGIRLWDIRVNVEADKEVVVDLTPAESPVSPNDFPSRG